MLIYRKTSRVVDWKAVFWFSLGVFVTLCVASYMHFDAAGGRAKANAAANAPESRPAVQPAPPARLPDPTTRMSANSNATPAAAHPAGGDSPRIAANTVHTDVSLFATSDVGRPEMAPVAPAPESSTPLLPPDAASALASPPSLADTELENKLRSNSDTPAQPPVAADTAPLPNEKP